MTCVASCPTVVCMARISAMMSTRSMLHCRSPTWRFVGTVGAAYIGYTVSAANGTRAYERLTGVNIQADQKSGEGPRLEGGKREHLVESLYVKTSSRGLRMEKWRRALLKDRRGRWN